MTDQKRAGLVAARNNAWAKVNAILDHNDRDAPEYREAFAEWEQAARAVIDHDQAVIGLRRAPDG